MSEDAHKAITAHHRPTMREFIIASIMRIGRFGPDYGSKIARLADASSLRVVADGQAIIHEAEEAVNVYIVCEGMFKIFNGDYEGNIALSSLALPGEIIGEIAAIDRDLRSATAVSSGISKVLNLGSPGFIIEILGSEGFYRLTSRAVCEKLRNLTALHQVIVCRNSVETVEEVIRTIVQRILRNEAQSRPIELCLTQRDLSQITGYSRETINRAFRQIYRDNIVFSGVTMCISLKVVERYMREMVAVVP